MGIVWNRKLFIKVAIIQKIFVNIAYFSFMISGLKIPADQNVSILPGSNTNNGNNKTMYEDLV